MTPFDFQWSLNVKTFHPPIPSTPPPTRCFFSVIYFYFAFSDAAAAVCRPPGVSSASTAAGASAPPEMVHTTDTRARAYYTYFLLPPSHARQQPSTRTDRRRNHAVTKFYCDFRRHTVTYVITTRECTRKRRWRVRFRFFFFFSIFDIRHARTDASFSFLPNPIRLCRRAGPRSAAIQTAGALKSPTSPRLQQNDPNKQVLLLAFRLPIRFRFFRFSSIRFMSVDFGVSRETTRVDSMR